MNKRPKISVSLTPADYFFEVIGAIGLACLIFPPVYFFNGLPTQIPKHFSALGQVDSYGSRGLIWLLPVIGLFLYIGLSFLTRVPHLFNYPVKVTNNNAEKLYVQGKLTIRLLKVIVVLSFAYLNFKTIEIALNRATEAGKLFLPALLIILALLIVTMIYKMVKK